MNKIYKIKEGLDIKLKGAAEKNLPEDISSSQYIVRPTDFIGVLPKLILKEGDSVKRGETIFFSKNLPEVKFTSPISGVVKQIVRGEKRKLMGIVVESDNKDEAIKFELSNSVDNAEKLKALMLDAGVWPFVIQRPYGIIANPIDTPRDIFISFFDSSPLAPDYDFILKDKVKEINIALSKLSLLVDSKIYLNFKKGSALLDLIEDKSKYEINCFSGAHPAGLLGVQINKIKPINKGDTVWTLDAANLPIIGHLLSTGEYLPEKTIALVGSEVLKPRYYNIRCGADISKFLEDKLTKNENRIISGNVLTGTLISDNPALGYYDSCISVIPEGNKYEMFGWMMPGLDKFSFSSTFVSKLFPKKKFVIDTNFHGGERAYVVTGEYEKVCPIDIYPQLLIKAILAKDVERMEELGIYEVIEEDLALCEFICTSKIEVQHILREGLKIMIEEMS